jgi:S1-C subfamily serine protease
MTFLTDLSNALAGLVSGVEDSIVRVEAREWTPASGVVISEGGLVVTADHAVTRDEQIRVGLADGRVLDARPVGRDPSTDLAVLQLDGQGFKALPAAGADALRVGALALAVARPGEKLRASLGIIGRAGGAWRTHAGSQVERFIQPDVVMYPGFSGGALLAADGALIGINTTGLARNAVLTLPVEAVLRVAADLAAHGHMRRAYLGVGTQPVRLQAGLAGEAGQETGLLVVSVEAGSPAEKAGLMVGDILVALDGQPLRHVDDLLTFLSGDRIGQSVTARLARGGALIQASIIPVERE